MEQKVFFRKRAPEEMREIFQGHIQTAYRQQNLINRIMDLDQQTEALEIRTPIIPMQFLRGGAIPQTAASRKSYKHGALIPIAQPMTQQEAYEWPHTPLIARMRAFDEAFRDLREEELYFIGISWRPVQGNDRRIRIVPFDVALEGAKLYNYSINQTSGVEVNPKYTDAGKVKKEGGTILCKVPSRTKRQSRYNLNLVHVPVVDGPESNAIVLSLRSQYEEGREPKRTTFLHHLRYEWPESATTSDVFVFGPHDVAAYLAVIRHSWKGLDHTVPLRMNPFPLPSKKWARFYDKLDNNTMIFDPTLVSKDKLRNLHLDEKAILLGRAIKVKGPYETAFWDKKRDGNVRDYWNRE